VTANRASATLATKASLVSRGGRMRPDRKRCGVVPRDTCAVGATRVHVRLQGAFQVPPQERAVLAEA
jgi:hypothetical protein